MITPAKSLSDQAVLLPPEERLALVDRLLDMLDEPDQALDALWATEASSRLAAYRRGEVKAVHLSGVVAKHLPVNPMKRWFQGLSFALPAGVCVVESLLNYRNMR